MKGFLPPPVGFGRGFSKQQSHGWACCDQDCCHLQRPGLEGPKGRVAQRGGSSSQRSRHCILFLNSQLVLRFYSLEGYRHFLLPSLCSFQEVESFVLLEDYSNAKLFVAPPHLTSPLACVMMSVLIYSFPLQIALPKDIILSP